MVLGALKQRINIKYFMVAYVGGLLVFSSFMLGAPDRLWKGLWIVILYAAFDLLWTYLRDRVWYVPVSSWISGFILSIVAIPAPSLTLIVLLPLLAVASKHLLHFGKNRHVYNPAAFAMAIVALFVPAVSWWGVTWSTVEWGRVPLAIVSVVGAFILWRQGRWHVALPFLASYAIFLSPLFLWGGIAVSQLLTFLQPQLIDGTTLFFATVMLIEPLTSMFPTKGQRVIYGTLVGFFAVLVTYLSGLWNWERQDPLVYGLLLGNLVASLLFLPALRRPAASQPAVGPLLPSPPPPAPPPANTPLLPVEHIIR